MNEFFEQLVARIWNRAVRPPEPRIPEGVALGHVLRDGRTLEQFVVWPHSKRAEHLAVLGKTGTGKSSLLRHLATEDVRCERGFISFDLHGDTTGYLLRLIAAEERRRRVDLSGKLIVIDPSDPDYSIGLNVLDGGYGQRGFVQIAEFTAILKQRWGLENLGARTEELLRNSLLALADNRLTLVELSPLLASAAFRAACLPRVRNSEVREYFETRYHAASEAMQATLRDPVLNKLTAFTADPAFRHIVGQQSSTFSLRAALDDGCWILVDINKGRVGEQAVTLGALILARVKSALFSRAGRQLFSVYADEIQNLVAIDSGMDTLLSEARKFAISVVSANQYLDQYSPAMRAAILSVASHVLFQLSSTDAEKMAAALDGGKALAEVLKNLPQRHFVAKIGHHRFVRGMVATVPEIAGSATDLYNRCRARWTRRRTEVEADIHRRQPYNRPPETGGLDVWE